MYFKSIIFLIKMYFSKLISYASQKDIKWPIGIHQSEVTCGLNAWAPLAILYLF